MKFIQILRQSTCRHCKWAGLKLPGLQNQTMSDTWRRLNESRRVRRSKNGSEGCFRRRAGSVSYSSWTFANVSFMIRIKLWSAARRPAALWAQRRQNNPVWSRGRVGLVPGHFVGHCRNNETEWRNVNTPDYWQSGEAGQAEAGSLPAGPLRFSPDVESIIWSDPLTGLISAVVSGQNRQLLSVRYSSSCVWTVVKLNVLVRSKLSSSPGSCCWMFELLYRTVLLSEAGQPEGFMTSHIVGSNPGPVFSELRRGLRGLRGRHGDGSCSAVKHFNVVINVN